MIRNQSLYAQGQAYWLTLKEGYGMDAANRAASAAASGDVVQLNNVLSDIKRVAAAHPGQPVTGEQLSSKDAQYDERGTAEIFIDQVTTDPLAAPLETANKLAKNSLLAFIKAPAFLLVVGIVGFFLLGGANVLKKQLAKLK